MKRLPVESSTIKSVGYDAKKSILEIEFKKRDGSFSAIWQYSPISKDVYEEFVGSSSLGVYFHENIKSNASLTHNKVK